MIFFTLQMFYDPFGKYDHPALNVQYLETVRRQITWIVPETVVSTDCSVDRILTTYLRWVAGIIFPKGGFVALIYGYR